VVLLLALPASGKSEIRKYLKHVSPETCKNDFHMGTTLQLDDFPYVHIMRCIDETLIKQHESPIFFEAPDKSFRDGRYWGALVQMVNDDYDDLLASKRYNDKSASEWLLTRMDNACLKVGSEAKLGALSSDMKRKVMDAVEKEASDILNDKYESYTNSFDDKTIVIEFARGGKVGATMPLPSPMGYQYSVAQLSPKILERAVVFYVYVSPEESRRKNAARYDPKDPGSSLHHMTPTHVMMNDYGSDDMNFLEANSGKEGMIAISAHGKTYYLPIARFDNQKDKTSFLRGDATKWPNDNVADIHTDLKNGFNKLKNHCL